MQTSDFRYFITSITILSTGSPSIDTSKNTEGFFFSLISPRFKDAGEKREEKHSQHIFIATLYMKQIIHFLFLGMSAII